MKLDDIPREHLEAVLAQLEAAKEQRQQDRPPGPWICLVAKPGESAEAAKARYRAENPDTPKNARWVIRMIVAVGPDSRCARSETRAIDVEADEPTRPS
jgi:hypothetical protein